MINWSFEFPKNIFNKCLFLLAKINPREFFFIEKLAKLHPPEIFSQNHSRNFILAKTDFSKKLVKLCSTRNLILARLNSIKVRLATFFLSQKSDYQFSIERKEEEI